MKEQPHRKLIQTDDGSSSIYNEALNETYHSTHGAIQESRHVFLKSGLEHCGARPANILEIGFGTGLNVLLTMEYAIRNEIPVRMVTLESEPLDANLVNNLNYTSQVDDQRAAEWFRWIHEQDWQGNHTYNEYFQLKKINTDWLRFDPGNAVFNIIYYDAFAPSKQPGMWTLECIKKACASLHDGGLFVTYSARGQLKRDLSSSGMKVESLPGPPGKKEMVRAVKQET
ncbi:MAG: tRNA (5-methylaminomethyl-2-thiouridine)(34)-methyltransferase MnmD [Cyclobacteriaceae bacterium]